MGDYCSCGNSKYPDADMCDACGRREAAQSGETSPTECSYCGRPKVYDADMCDRCWNRRRPYGG